MCPYLTLILVGYSFQISRDLPCLPPDRYGFLPVGCARLNRAYTQQAGLQIFLLLALSHAAYLMGTAHTLQEQPLSHAQLLETVSCCMSESDLDVVGDAPHRLAAALVRLLLRATLERTPSGDQDAAGVTHALYQYLDTLLSKQLALSPSAVSFFCFPLLDSHDGLHGRAGADNGGVVAAGDEDVDPLDMVGHVGAEER